MTKILGDTNGTRIDLDESTFIDGAPKLCLSDGRALDADWG